MAREGSLGRFITLEGIEGSGKSTQARRLHRSLEAEGLPVVLTREPGGTPVGERIRAILLDPASTGLSPRAELMLYAAARSHHVESVIRPALERGALVLCDRFSDATAAYQGYGRGLSPQEVDAVNALACRGLVPDLTLLLDLPAEEGLRRARRRNREEDAHAAARFEEEDLAFHRRVREGYLALAASATGRIVLVPATGTEEEIAGLIRERVTALLEEA